MAMAKAVFLACLCLIWVDAWEPPLGIPRPEFGIEESHTMYVGQSYEYEGGAGPYGDAGNGPYTHFVNNTHPEATDSGNPYGTADRPRETVPDMENVAPGAVIEIQGGRYDLGYFILSANGTAEKPVFFRGSGPDSKPTFFGGDFFVAGHYLIVENLDLEQQPLTVRPVREEHDVHHVSIRHCYSYGNSERNAFSTTVYLEGKLAEDIVYYNNHIAGAGFDTSVTGPSFPEDDNAGVAISSHSRRVWIVDNEIHSLKGDGVGAGHGANYSSGDYYIGRNHIHHNGENAVDFKELENIIVSQNVMHSFYGHSSGSDGTAAVAHYGPSVSPKNVWFLFNQVYNCNGNAFQVGGDQEYDVHFVGNIVRDIHNSNGNASGYITWSSRDVYFLNNLFYDVDIGINSGVERSGARLFLINNIIANVSPSGYHIDMTGSSHMSNSVISHNLFYQPGGSVRINWGSDVYGLGGFQSASGKCQGCLEGDPLFTDVSQNDFSLRENSPARDAGTVHGLYQTYQDVNNGWNISYDILGAARSQGVTLDIGPHEYTGGSNVGPSSGSAGLGFGYEQMGRKVIFRFRTETEVPARVEIFEVRGSRLFSLEGVSGSGLREIRLDLDKYPSVRAMGSRPYIAKLTAGSQSLSIWLALRSVE